MTDTPNAAILQAGLTAAGLNHVELVIVPLEHEKPLCSDIAACELHPIIAQYFFDGGKPKYSVMLSIERPVWLRIIDERVRRL
jgi:hypothetical protein